MLLAVAELLVCFYGRRKGSEESIKLSRPLEATELENARLQNLGNSDISPLKRRAQNWWFYMEIAT